jgi:hypothetical protein
MTKLKQLYSSNTLNPVLYHITNWVNSHHDETQEPILSDYIDYEEMIVKPAHYLMKFNEEDWQWEVLFFDTYETIEELPF